jgi:hypothetical protein
MKAGMPTQPHDMMIDRVYESTVKRRIELQSSEETWTVSTSRAIDMSEGVVGDSGES